jgi:hypothetical protein
LRQIIARDRAKGKRHPEPLDDGESLATSRGRLHLDTLDPIR